MKPTRRPTLPATLAIALLLQAILPTAQATEPATQPTAHTSATKSPRPTPLQGDAKLLLVLDRFTYGPRPGDLDHLRQIGLQAWFNEQLNPQSIDDSALDIRLADYPAMQLPLPGLMRQYPDQPMVRKVLNGNAFIPPGPAERAIYNNQIARLEAKLDTKKQLGEMAPPTASQTQTQPPADPLPFTPTDALAMPPDQRFNAICRLSPEQQKALRDALLPADRPRLTEGFSPLQLEQFAALERPAAVVAAEAVQTKLLRDIYSERQLNEIMTDFWLNHFNVYLRKNQFAPYYIAAYARDTIRPRALGNFENLLVATAVSPAMLSYLDNASSVGPNSPFANRPNGRFNQNKKADIGLNENYARELMELHTLGVDGGYTQHDVTEVAKVFTGWTLGDPSQPRGPGGQYRGPGLPVVSEFDITKHQPGTKLVLGQTIQPNGEREGLEVLHMLATSPSTARFISTKLAVRFVSDNPPPAMIDRMTKTFLATNGNIRQVLIAMVNSPEFFTSVTEHAKVKTPVDFVVSAVRASGAEVESAGALVDVIANLGMPIYGMQTPNGYSMKADPWNNTASLVARLNFALALSTNRVVGVRTNWDALLIPTAALAAAAQAATAKATNQSASQPTSLPASQSATQPQLPEQSLDQSITQLVNEPAETGNVAASESTANGQAANRPAAMHPADNSNSQIARLPAATKETLLEAKLLHEAASERTHQAILAQINADPTQQQASLRQVAIENRSRDPLAIYRIPPPKPAANATGFPPPKPPTTATGTPANALSFDRAPGPLDLQAALAAGLLFGSPEFQRR